jgi:hypothetical protein
MMDSFKMVSFNPRKLKMLEKILLCNLSGNSSSIPDYTVISRIVSVMFTPEVQSSWIRWVGRGSLSAQKRPAAQLSKDSQAGSQTDGQGTSH